MMTIAKTIDGYLENSGRPATASVAEVPRHPGEMRFFELLRGVFMPAQYNSENRYPGALSFREQIRINADLNPI